MSTIIEHRIMLIILRIIQTQDDPFSRCESEPTDPSKFREQRIISGSSRSGGNLVNFTELPSLVRRSEILQTHALQTLRRPTGWKVSCEYILEFIRFRALACACTFRSVPVRFSCLAGVELRICSICHRFGGVHKQQQQQQQQPHHRSFYGARKKGDSYGSVIVVLIAR